MNLDLASMLREFGLSAIIVLFIGWMLYVVTKSVVLSFIPSIASAIIDRIKSGTALADATTIVVARIPEVVSESSKETRAAIASFEKAMIASEGRIVSAFSNAILAVKDEIHDRRQDQIDHKLGRLARVSRVDVDSDAPPPLNANPRQ